MRVRRQLLLDCGIGTASAEGEAEAAAVVSQHRALVFCQLKKMLDIVERDLLQRHLPAVAYLRLDGAVPPHQRHAIVTRFNSDVSIDLLLLTTAVSTALPRALVIQPPICSYYMLVVGYVVYFNYFKGRDLLSLPNFSYPICCM